MINRIMILKIIKIWHVKMMMIVEEVSFYVVNKQKRTKKQHTYVSIKGYFQY